jgi:serine/threonine protein kinase, bacterial
VLLATPATDIPPEAFLAKLGDVFAVFGENTQDSGNVSYGVRVGTERFFIKTAGLRSAQVFLSYDARIALLRNAIKLSGSLSDPTLPALRQVVETPEGPLLVYDWVDGELVGVTRARRSDPASAFARFRALPAPEISTALDAVFRLQTRLAAIGWVACDFYDGSLIYDFEKHDIHVVDLDSYHEGSFTNTMGRMFGSTRFMAPEEFQLGARIDERTTVFVMGRTIEQLFPSCSTGVAEVAARACEADPLRRFQTLREFHDAWSAAR